MSLQTQSQFRTDDTACLDGPAATPTDFTSMSDERLSAERELIRRDWQEMVSHAGNSMADIELLVTIDKSLTAIAVEQRRRSMARHPSSMSFQPRP